MGLTLEAEAPPIKIGGEWRPDGEGPHEDPEVRVGYGLVHAPATAKHLSGVTLRELRVSVLADGYRVMLKGDRGGKPKVAFFHGLTWRGVITIAVTSLDCAYAEWWDDKYPPKR